MKLRFLLLFATILPSMAWAQFENIPVTQIQNIQGWVGQFLPDSCNDGPNPLYLNDTVKIRGVAIVNGGVTISSSNARWIWMRDITATPGTPFANISVRFATATSPVDILNVLAGDTLEVVGIVQEFQGSGTPAPLNSETQIAPIANGVNLIGQDIGPAPQSFLLTNLGELNGDLNANNHPNNHITTGEKYEGNFIEIQNVTVVTIQPDAANDRFRFLVKDANNNHIWIYDRFKTQRPSNGFIGPNVGDTYTSIKGIIESWKNGCPGTNANTNRGYNLNPFSLEHYVKGASSPTIGNITRVPVCPAPAAGPVVSATITDDGSIQSVEVLYSTNGTTYTSIPATASGVIYSATLPVAANGALMRYYFRATDNLSNTTLFPNVPAGAAPLFYTVNGAGCTIRDIQFTPNTNGRSGYENLSVTLQGVVTASAANDNLGYVYIQQPNQSDWAGIWVNGGTLITGLNVGDVVNVTGVINEYFGLTRITNVTDAQVVSTGQPIDPIALNPNIFTAYSFADNEKYEGMLIKLENPAAGQNLFVVDTNPDAANNANNGEYRIGADNNDPNSGCRVLAGRQDGTAFSSLNVSYVNSPRWATESGVMNVPVLLLTPGDVVEKVQGVMTYSFSNMKLLPRNNNDVSIQTSLKPLLSGGDYTLFPNPTAGFFQVRFDLAVQNATIDLVNTQGKLINSASVNGTEVRMSAKGIAPGLYLIRVKDNTGKLLAIRTLAIQK